MTSNKWLLLSTCCLALAGVQFTFAVYTYFIEGNDVHAMTWISIVMFGLSASFSAIKSEKARKAKR